MRSSKLFKMVPVLGVVLLFLWIASFVARPGQAAAHRQEVKLIAPPFLEVHSPTGTTIGEMLDEEAGISAWYDAPDVIDLELVEPVFRTIELQTTDYLIGSVAVSNYPEVYDVHVYVHVDGWILAYYLNTDPVSKIVDVKGQTLETTHLKNVVAVVAGAAGLPVTDVSYYDFRYPNATNMLLVAENSSDGNFFSIEIPSSFAYFERSWGLFYPSCCNPYFTFDGVSSPNQIYWDGVSGFGTITAAQFVPDTPHTVTANTYGVVVIVYRVP